MKASVTWPVGTQMSSWIIPRGSHFSVGLAFDRHADEQAGPRVIRRRQAVIEQELPEAGQMRDRRRIARVAVVIHPAVEQAGRALAQVAVHPVIRRLGCDATVRVDLPQAREQIVRIGAAMALLVSVHGYLFKVSDAMHAEVALAVESPIPGRDHAVRVGDGGVPVVSGLDREAPRGIHEHRQKENHAESPDAAHVQEGRSRIGRVIPPEIVHSRRA